MWRQEVYNGAWPYETAGNALCCEAPWPGWLLLGSSCSPERKKKIHFFTFLFF